MSLYRRYEKNIRDLDFELVVAAFLKRRPQFSCVTNNGCQLRAAFSFFDVGIARKVEPGLKESDYDDGTGYQRLYHQRRH